VLDELNRVQRRFLENSAKVRELLDQGQTTLGRFTKKLNFRSSEGFEDVEGGGGGGDRRQREHTNLGVWESKRLKADRKKR